jgi:hypothetical protein
MKKHSIIGQVSYLNEVVKQQNNCVVVRAEIQANKFYLQESV